MKKKLIYLYCKGIVKLFKIYLLREDRATKVNKMVKNLNPLYNKMKKADDQRLRKLALKMIALEVAYLVYHNSKELEALEYERFIKMRWCE